MFFVGHISIAFIIGYLITTRFQIRNISISLILFLSILPDIDILFRFTGADVTHRSITHSITVLIIILFVFVLKYRRPSIIIYFLAYLSHLVIGDLLVGPLNLLHPFGSFNSSGGIDFKTPEHIAIESLVLAIMAIIVIGQSLRTSRGDNTHPFAYSEKLDPIFYPMVVIGIIISLLFLLDESQKEFEFPNILFSLFRSYDKFDTIAIVALHVICTAIVILLWIVTRRTYLYNFRTKQKSSGLANTNYN